MQQIIISGIKIKIAYINICELFYIMMKIL